MGGGAFVVGDGKRKHHPLLACDLPMNDRVVTDIQLFVNFVMQVRHNSVYVCAPRLALNSANMEAKGVLNELT